MSTNIPSFNSATIVGKKTDEPDKKDKTVMVFGKQTSLIKFRYDGKCDTLAILPNRYETSSTHTNAEQTDYLTTADLIKVDGKTIAQKNMRVFLSTIENNKESLMKDLGLNEPEYYRLMNIALGIAEQETHFGDYTFIDPCNNENWQKRLHVKNFISALPISCSKGLTQIKYSANFQDGSKNKAIASKYGIKSDEDYKDNTSKCAIATMIILAKHLREAESPLWQNRLKENNAKIKNPKEHIYTDDIIALLWNGTGLVDERFEDKNDTVKISDENTANDWLIQFHLKSKDGMSYSRYVRYYRENFFNGKIQ